MLNLKSTSEHSDFVYLWAPTKTFSLYCVESNRQSKILSSIESMKSLRNHKRKSDLLKRLTFSSSEISDQKSCTKITRSCFLLNLVTMNEEKSWRTRLKSSELCLILCLSGHNTQCCVSIAVRDKRTEDGEEMKPELKRWTWNGR